MLYLVLGILVARRGGRHRPGDHGRRRGTTAPPPVDTGAPARGVPAPADEQAAAEPEAPRRPSPPSSGRKVRRRGWSGCGSGSPVRRAGSAAGCSSCSRATASTRTPGRRSRTPCSPPTSASRRPRSWSSGCARGCASRRQRGGRPARRPARRAAHAGRPGHGPSAPGVRSRRQARRRARGRRQRHRQDDDRRQARPDPGRRGPDGRARRGRHVPRGGRRAAGHVGRAGRRRRGPRTRGLRPGQRRVRGGAGGRRPRAPTPCSSTPPAACRTRPG